MTDLEIAQLQTELTTARHVVDAARCIRNWHNTGRNDEGMVVSSEHVYLLWEALGRYDTVLEIQK